ncbi:MAG: DUF1501 domain-containing protein [Planctomycetes bacterium]|nr:DUF1501 domain-containing protein [Planctomycetota bacterium]
MKKAHLTRRGFLGRSVVAAGATAVGSAAAAQRAGGRATRCIVLFLTGGPSQLETFDPKPAAASEIRGPFASIPTSVTGIRISEHLPRLAALAHRFTIIRTVHHDGPPVHEAGMQLLQTGRLSLPGVEFPHFGAVLASFSLASGPSPGGRAETSVAPFVVLPGPLGDTGINVSRGQGAGVLGSRYEPAHPGPFAGAQALTFVERERYGKTPFGDACARAVRLVEGGTRCVVVNMFETVFDRVTWDCHADRNSLRSTLDDYRRTLCPMLDRGAGRLLEELHQRGLLDETLVLIMGEFGRTPRLNANGGRDHWPGCWSILMAGGGVRGGRVIGASDRHAAEPVSRPVTCAEVVASVYNAIGVPLATRLQAPDRRTWPLVEAAPLPELH